MTASRVRRLLPWAGIAVSVLFAYLAIRDVDLQSIWTVLARGNYSYLGPAIAVLAIGIYLRVIRWQVLFAREPRPPKRALTNSLLIGYLFNGILPARAGEVARVVVLHQQAGTSRAEAMATVVSERVLDVLVLLALLLAAAPIVSNGTWMPRTLAVGGCAFVLLTSALVLVAFYGRRPVRFVLRPLTVLPNVAQDQIDRAAANVVEGLAVFRRPDIAIRAVGWTALSWLVIALAFWLCMLSVHLGTGIDAAIIVVIAVNLAMILPSGPAALGVFEAATVLALAPFGVTRSQALPFAVVVHAVSILPVMVVGYVALHRHVLAIRNPNRRRPHTTPLMAEANGPAARRVGAEGA